MSILSRLDPAPIWKYFEEICKIPRLSKNEAAIREYLLKFAASHNFESKEDSAGNVLIIKPASPGYENIRTLVLQSHMDMVGEKNSDHPHNWAKDPIVPVVNDGWVSASGTTLGADDGIGIASQLAVLDDTNLKSGKIECLFTTDEETGMTGALNLKPDFFEGRTLLNLDSEDEGIFYIGCAGGMDTVVTIHYDVEAVKMDCKGIGISLTGLHGGHSGDEIHKGYGNAIKLMNRIINDLTARYSVSLVSFNGGNLRNAIPREAFAVIATGSDNAGEVKKEILDFRDKFISEFSENERHISLGIKEVETPRFAMVRPDQQKLLDAIDCCPHGVITWSKDMEDLVETSTNLASVSFDDKETIRVVTTQRSSYEPSKFEIARKVKSCFSLLNSVTIHSDGYPAWTPSMNSEILKIAKSAFASLTGKEPAIKAIHAGLECGLIFEKYNGIDIISFGPSIRGAHTPEEKIEIKSVKIFWELLKEIIRNIPEERK